MRWKGQKHWIAAVVCSFVCSFVFAQTPSAPRVGLVLSGGGARGFAHIGALKALEQLRIPIDVVAATSMGAMVGGGYALGYSPEQLEKITLDVNWVKMFAPRADRSELSWRRKSDDNIGLAPAEVGLTAKGISLPSEAVPTQELDIFLSEVTQPVNRVNHLGNLAIPFAAIATDLESGQRVVLQDNVTLSQAMRASMSVPGAFSPVQYRNQLLVDGGLVDNLPVGQARAMGADCIIAINVGTPLSRRSELGNVVGVMGQMINILTEQNVRESLLRLSGDDVLVVPDLEQVTSADFDRAQEIIRLGYDAVMKKKASLERFQLAQEDYERWLEKRRDYLNTESEHQLSQVVVRGLSRVNPERVLSQIQLDTAQKISNDEIAQSARHVWAGGDFNSVPYRFEPGPNGTEVLVFKPVEKPWGYSTLRFGGNLQSNFRENHTFNVLLAHTWGWLNTWGAEWRTEIQLGQERRALTQWYQPLGASSDWFIMPQMHYQWTPFDVYDGDDAVARYRNEQFQAEVVLGRELARLGQVSVSAGYLHHRLVKEIGPWDTNLTTKSPYLGASLEFDTLDNASFPRSGFLLEGQVKRLRNVADDTVDTLYQAKAKLPFALNRDWTVVLSGKMGASTMSGYFNLGGVFNLSGSPYGRFSGDHMVLGRAIVMRSLSRELEAKGMPVFLGASYELGRVYDKQDGTWREEKMPWTRAASVFAAADTWIGPVFLVAGHTFGHGNALTFYWGRLQ